MRHRTSLAIIIATATVPLHCIMPACAQSSGQARIPQSGATINTKPLLPGGARGSAVTGAGASLNTGTGGVVGTPPAGLNNNPNFNPGSKLGGRFQNSIKDVGSAAKLGSGALQQNLTDVAPATSAGNQTVSTETVGTAVNPTGTVTNTDGSTTTSFPGGTSERTPDGTVVQRDGRGNLVSAWFSDGSEVHLTPAGDISSFGGGTSTTTKNPDGGSTTVTVFPNGSSITTTTTVNQFGDSFTQSTFADAPEPTGSSRTPDTSAGEEHRVGHSAPERDGSDSGGSGSGSGNSSSSSDGHSTGSDGTLDRKGSRGGSGSGGDSIFQDPTKGSGGPLINQFGEKGTSLLEGGAAGNVLEGAAGNAVKNLGNRLNSQFNGVEVGVFSKTGGPAAGTTESGFRNGGSPFAPGGRFSGVASPGNPINLPGGAGIGSRAKGVLTPSNLQNSATKIPSVTGGANLLPATGNAGRSTLTGVPIKTPNVNINTNSIPVGGIKTNVPNFTAGSTSIKVPAASSFNLGGNGARNSIALPLTPKSPAAIPSARQNITIPGRR